MDNYLKKYFEKCNKPKIFIILIIGLIFMLGANYIGKTPENKNTGDLEKSEFSDTEKRLEKILSEIQGAGDVDVMISYDGTGKVNYASDTTYSEDKEEKKTVLAGGSAIPVNKSYPSIRGVIVVSSGASVPKVKESLISAVRSGLGISENKIGVFTKK